MQEPDDDSFAGGQEKLNFTDNKENGAAVHNAALTGAIMHFTYKGIINRF
jgi:hypothetical protein